MLAVHVVGFEAFLGLPRLRVEVARFIFFWRCWWLNHTVRKENVGLRTQYFSDMEKFDKMVVPFFGLVFSESSLFEKYHQVSQGSLYYPLRTSSYFFFFNGKVDDFGRPAGISAVGFFGEKNKNKLKPKPKAGARAAAAGGVWSIDR